MFNRIGLIILTLGALWAESPQASFDLSYQGAYSSNLFMNASSVSDYISTLQGEFNLSLNRFNLYLNGSTSLLAKNNEFNSWQIEPGLEYLLPLEGRSAIYFSVAFPILRYHELYTDFNYSGPRLQSSLKLYLSPQTLLKGDYQFEYRRFDRFPSFDFTNHTLSLELSRFFPSQTTLRLQGAFNWRHYPHIDAAVGDAQESTNAQDRGQGQQGPGQQGPATMTLSVPNISTKLALSQSLGTRFGVTVEAEYRHNFSGLETAQTLIDNAYLNYPYNDNHLWDGLRLGLQFKAILWNEWALTASAVYSDKGYAGIFVMDETGAVLSPSRERADTQTALGLGISKKFSLWELTAACTYVDNHSNDDYFQYRMVSLSAGIGYSF